MHVKKKSLADVWSNARVDKLKSCAITQVKDHEGSDQGGSCGKGR